MWKSYKKGKRVKICALHHISLTNEHVRLSFAYISHAITIESIRLPRHAELSWIIVKSGIIHQKFFFIKRALIGWNFILFFAYDAKKNIYHSPSSCRKYRYLNAFIHFTKYWGNRVKVFRCRTYIKLYLNFRS